jgi:DNA-binding beta-propeller fold protein YncE
LPGTCVYVADALSATKGILYAYDTSGAVVFSLNVSTTPSALAVDHTRQRLYAAIATNLLAYPPHRTTSFLFVLC